MSERPTAVFLERQTYRRRRLVDWLRILPLVGLALWMLPLLWSGSEAETTHTASAMIYIFLVWFALAIAAGISAHVLGRVSQNQSGSAPDGDP